MVKAPQLTTDVKATIVDSKPKSSSVLAAEAKLREFYAKAQVELENKLPEADRKDSNKQAYCAEYAGGICTYMCERQRVTAARYGYMKNQPELNEKMRAVLMDWMCAVCEKFNLLHETLFLATNLVDRYLEQEKVSKAKLQLVGVAALVIASKYEEIYPPEIRDFIHLTERTVSKDEVIKMEGQILKRLKFELSGPSILRFLERFNKLLGGSEQMLCLGMYFAELQLLDYNMLKHMPSMIAAASVYLANKVAKGSAPVWGEYIRSQSGLSEEDVKTCAKELLEVVKTEEKAGTQATKKRFGQKKLMEVAKMRIEGVSL